MIYGRVSGIKLGITAKKRLQEQLPTYALDLKSLQSPEDFAKELPVMLEIGFGGGEHLAHWALQHQTHMCIGVEPFTNGIASLLRHIDELELDNIRIVRDDARLVLQSLPDQSMTHIAILFPDPWPKTRHHKRRIVSPETIAQCHRCLRPGGELLIATDHVDYLTTIKKIMAGFEDRFSWTNRNETSRPMNHVQTRYETKAINEGRTPVWMHFISQ